jgi:hypothetical protein
MQKPEIALATQSDKSVPPEAIVTGTWFGNLHGFPEFWTLDGD